MNQRIRALAEQAGMTDDKFGMFFAKDFDSHCADGVDLAKFAELIVRECLVVINQPNGVGDDDVIRISQDVKIHFGVEE